ncbi:hypothetical protein FNV43_RR02290 [Rhamnella rubrinervis]|uniref:Uncharacterized protein n=1 Tax=Rhamnella rubrinervis TaxID=2594499 RepID=A0A8K0HRD6_9ROSA|nr:hypothetical protein FNV43_RR02290 [Rhamnella rubrinervis]
MRIALVFSGETCITNLSSVIVLAASAQNKCTALVWSCYVPSGGSHNKVEENSNSNIREKQFQAEKKDGVKEEVDNNEAKDYYSSRNINGGSSNSRSSSGSNGPHIAPSNLKSNLKKAVQLVDENQSRTERRKVNWPDAHGKDIAHIQEFEPSVSEDGELEGVRNSCVCAIQ